MLCGPEPRGNLAMQLKMDADILGNLWDIGKSFLESSHRLSILF